MSYTIKANRSSVHIAGIDERTQSTGADNGSGVVPYYAESACGALTRSGSRMEQLGSYDDIAEAIKHATYATYSISGRKVCKKCLAAAEALLAEQTATPAETVVEPAEQTPADADADDVTAEDIELARAATFALFATPAETTDEKPKPRRNAETRAAAARRKAARMTTHRAPAESAPRRPIRDLDASSVEFDAERMREEMTRTCTACGELVEHIDGVGWVEIREGGHYDQCPERYIEATDTVRGHIV